MTSPQVPGEPWFTHPSDEYSVHFVSHSSWRSFVFSCCFLFWGFTTPAVSHSSVSGWVRVLLECISAVPPLLFSHTSPYPPKNCRNNHAYFPWEGHFEAGQTFQLLLFSHHNQVQIHRVLKS